MVRVKLKNKQNTKEVKGLTEKWPWRLFSAFVCVLLQ